MELQAKKIGARVTAASFALAALAGTLRAQATEQWQLSPPAGTVSQRWGMIMDEKNGVLVCGAPYEDTKASDAGAVTVYRYDATTKAWVYEAQLFASDFEANARFGTAVAVDGNLIVVGAPYKDTTKGADGGQVYVFRYDATNKVWNQEQKLLPSVGIASDWFGSAVDVSGNGVIVGAPRADTNAGADSGCAFVFRYANPFVKWVEEKQLLDPDGLYSDYAGTSVAFEGSMAIVASPYAQEGLNYGGGSVGVWTVSGTTWTQVQEVLPTTGQSNANFGTKVRLRGNLLGVTCPSEDYSATVLDSGSVYVYELSGGSFAFQTKFTAKTPTAYTYYGNDFDFSDDLVVIGFQTDTVSGKGSCGSAHLYRHGPKSGWVYDIQLGASDSAASDRFGAQVLLANGEILVSAEGNDTASGSDWGVLYGFDDSEILLTITPSNPTPNQTMTFKTVRGNPGDVVMVTISDIDGVPYFLPLLVYVFAADDTLTFTADAPSPLYGLTVGMRSWKISPTGPVVFSDMAFIDV